MAQIYAKRIVEERKGEWGVRASGKYSSIEALSIKLVLRTGDPL